MRNPFHEIPKGPLTWQRWYAWHPVWCSDTERLVWLKWVERFYWDWPIIDHLGGPDDILGWEYRECFSNE